jgi:mRNA-degrading endonuclease RelE of RelBE toxin-antitoxin system
MQTVAETPTFTRQAEKLFDEDQKQELIAFLARNPTAGDVVPDTGGVRKLRFAASGRGKRGGARVIYYSLDETIPLYCLLAYPKNTKSDVTPDEKRAVSALVDALKAARKARQ